MFSVHIVFPLFDGVTQLDFTAPHQAFSRVPGARVTVASVGGREVAGRSWTRPGPAPPFDAGRPERAPAEVLVQVRKRLDSGIAARRAAVDEAVRRLQPA